MRFLKTPPLNGSQHIWLNLLLKCLHSLYSLTHFKVPSCPPSHLFVLPSLHLTSHSLFLSPSSLLYPSVPCLSSLHSLVLSPSLIHYTPPSKACTPCTHKHTHANLRPFIYCPCQMCGEDEWRDTQRHSALSSCVSVMYHKLTHVSNSLTVLLIGCHVCGDGGWWPASAYPRAAFPSGCQWAALPWWCHFQAVSPPPSDKAYWLLEERRESSDDEFDE